MLVFVKNKHNKPLMPCSPAKAKRLLSQGKAKVAKRTPFTIKLLFNSSGYFSISDIEGKSINNSINIKKGIRRMASRGGCLMQELSRREPWKANAYAAIPSTAKASGSPC